MRTGRLLGLFTLAVLWGCSKPESDSATDELGRQGSDLRMESLGMNDLIVALHDDLLQSRDTIPWLSEYTTGCLHQDQGAYWISYMPDGQDRVPPLPQTANQIYLGYCLLSFDYSRQKGGTNANDFYGISECRFPLLDSQIFGMLVIGNQAKDRIRELVLRRCSEFQLKFSE